MGNGYNRTDVKDSKNLTFPEKRTKENDPASGNKEPGKGLRAFIHKYRWPIIIFLAVNVIAAIVIVIVVVNNNKNKINTEPFVTVTDKDPGRNGDICILGQTVISVSEDGICGLTLEGVWKWEYQTELQYPSVLACDNYAVVTERDKDTLLIFNESGLLKRDNVKGNVVFASADKDHVGIVFTDEKDSYCFGVYDMSLEDPLLFIRKTASSYVISGDVCSSEGFAVTTGFEGSSGASVGVISFLRMSDGESYAQKVFEDCYYPIAVILGRTVFAGNTEKLTQIRNMPSSGTENDFVKDIWERKGSSDHLTYMTASDSRVLCIFENIRSESSGCKAVFYNEQGEATSTYDLDIKVSGVYSDGKGFLICSGQDIYYFTKEGKTAGICKDLADTEKGSVRNNVAAVISGGRLVIVDYGRTASDGDSK